jgi:thioredoxin-dependent peroxiredoxin
MIAAGRPQLALVDRDDLAGNRAGRVMAKVREGDEAPDFELEGSGSRTYRLADYRGQGLILAFYPGDFTPVCTRQFCSYRDDGDRIDALGVTMLGISPQTVVSHERFIAENGLNVPLLSDPDKRVARSYGVVGPGGFVRRSIFLVDAEGIIRYRHVALFGLRYQGVGDLERVVERLP